MGLVVLMRMALWEIKETLKAIVWIFISLQEYDKPTKKITVYRGFEWENVTVKYDV